MSHIKLFTINLELGIGKLRIIKQGICDKIENPIIMIPKDEMHFHTCFAQFEYFVIKRNIYFWNNIFVFKIEIEEVPIYYKRSTRFLHETKKLEQLILATYLGFRSFQHQMDVGNKINWQFHSV